MSRLDDAITRAHDLTVRDDHARHYVAELSRWARPVAEPHRMWLPWLASGAALAAAAAVIVLLVTRPRSTPDAIRIGERVAIVVEPNTQYRVLVADAERTDVYVERGAVTARLWPGTQPHRLALRSAGIEAVATGTVFGLHVDAQGASVHVHEGNVAVTRGGKAVQVAAGATWPASAAAPDRRAAERLLAMTPALPIHPTSAAPPDTTSETPTAPPVDAGADEPADAPALPIHTSSDLRVDAGAAVQVDAEPPADAARPPTLTERYREARLLRGQGSFDAAIRECLAIADANDPTWSPIALVEAARIELGPRASPERAIALAERLIADWPSHQLAPEARELRCRALRQLGRAAECSPKKP